MYSRSWRHFLGDDLLDQLQTGHIDSGRELASTQEEGQIHAVLGADILCSGVDRSRNGFWRGSNRRCERREDLIFRVPRAVLGVPACARVKAYIATPGHSFEVGTHPAVNNDLPVTIPDKEGSTYKEFAL